MQNRKLRMLVKSTCVLVALLVLGTEVDRLVAQTVQLPVFRTFGVRTAVSVPDGGTINLGGVGRSSFGRSSQSGFGRLPGGACLGGHSSSRSSLSAKIIRLKELEQQILADHAANRIPPSQVEINGSHAVQEKADFISRHVGR